MADDKKLIKKAIRDVQTRENRHKKIVRAVAVVIIVAVAALAIRYYFYGGKAFYADTERVSYGNVERLSYDVPELDSMDLIISDRKIINAVCENPGAIKCIEPVADSFFVKNIRTSIMRYEQAVFFRIKNTEDTAISVKSVSLVSASRVCYSNDPMEFDLGPFEESERFTFICIEPVNPNDILAKLEVGYVAYDEGRQSISSIKTA